jgi:uncharacterized protein YkwD
MARLSLLASIAVFALLLPAAAQDQDEITKLRDDLHKQINDLRAKDNVAALKRNAKLDEMAQKHAENMAAQDKYGDDGKNGHILDGKDPADRLKVSGYKAMEFGENVAYARAKTGPMAVEGTVAGWDNSPPHHKNFMNGRFVDTGIGLAQGKSGTWYFCQTFGKPLKK